MSINPLTGAPMPSSQPVAQPQAAAKPQSVFPESIEEKMDREVNSDEARQYQEIANKASRTKFATGDRETDIRNYLKFKGNIAGLLSMLGEE